MLRGNHDNQRKCQRLPTDYSINVMCTLLAQGESKLLAVGYDITFDYYVTYDALHKFLYSHIDQTLVPFEHISKKTIAQKWILLHSFRITFNQYIPKE